MAQRDLLALGPLERAGSENRLRQFRGRRFEDVGALAFVPQPAGGDRRLIAAPFNPGRRGATIVDDPWSPPIKTLGDLREGGAWRDQAIAGGVAIGQDFRPPPEVRRRPTVLDREPPAGEAGM